MTTGTKVQIIRLAAPNSPELKESVDPHPEGQKSSTYTLVSYGRLLRVGASLKVGTSGWKEIQEQKNVALGE